MEVNELEKWLSSLDLRSEVKTKLVGHECGFRMVSEVTQLGDSDIDQVASTCQMNMGEKLRFKNGIKNYHASTAQPTPIQEAKKEAKPFKQAAVPHKSHDDFDIKPQPKPEPTPEIAHTGLVFLQPPKEVKFETGHFHIHIHSVSLMNTKKERGMLYKTAVFVDGVEVSEVNKKVELEKLKGLVNQWDFKKTEHKVGHKHGIELYPEKHMESVSYITPKIDKSSKIEIQVVSVFAHLSTKTPITTSPYADSVLAGADIIDSQAKGKVMIALTSTERDVFGSLAWVSYEYAYA